MKLFKIRILFTVLFICSAIIFYSCEKESIISSSENVTNQDLTPQKAKQKSYMLNTYKIVGEKHNESLDSAFAIMSKAKVDISSKQHCADQFENAINKSLVKLKYSESFCIKTNRRSFSEIISNGMEKSPSVKDNSTLISNLNISNDLKSLIIKLIEASDNTNWSIKKYNAYVDDIDNIAINTLETKELEIYFPASSVARNSFEYWRTNLRKWAALMNGGKNISIIEPNTRFKAPTTETNPYDSPLLKGLTGADVGGAVAGAITSAVTGPGVAVGAAVGAAGVSTAKFVENCWNSIFH